MSWKTLKQSGSMSHSLEKIIRHSNKPHFILIDVNVDTCSTAMYAMPSHVVIVIR